MGLGLIMAAVRAWGFWAAAREWLAAALRWIAASPARLLGALAVVLALVALWQHREARHWADKARATQSAWDADRAQAIATKTAAETRYRNLAHDADQAHAAALAEGDKRLAAYIAAHRLRPGAQTDPTSPAQSGGAAVPAGAPTDPIVAPVAVAEADLRACDADYAYARAAYDWARGL